MNLSITSDSFFRKESRPMAMGLIIVGAALGMYMNFYFGNIGWNNILMFAAILMLPNWRNILNFRLPFVNRTFKIILIFQFVCIIYMMMGGIIDGTFLTYMVFTILMVLGIMSQNRNDMPLCKIIWYSWIFGWICLLFCCCCLISGAYFIEYAHLHDGSGYQSILIDLTMAGNLYTFIACCLYYLKGSKKEAGFSVLGIILGLILIVILGKRTPLLISFIAISVYLFRFYPISRKINKKTILYFVAVGFIIIFLFQIPGLSMAFKLVIERSVNGIIDMIHGTSSTGAAAVERYKLRDWAFDYIDNNFTLVNYIFGAGYMTKWLDAPLVQAYLDMGIIGICIYSYYVIIKPIKITFSKLSKYPIVYWGCALNFYNIFSALNSGIPYGHLRWIPLIVLILTLRTVKCKNRFNNEILHYA